MSSRTLLQRTRDFYSEHGVFRTLGAVALFCGRAVDDRCETLHRMRSEDSGKGHPLPLRLRAARHGFSGNLYLLLGLEDANPDHYLHSVAPIRDLNDGHIDPIHHKRTFQQLTEPYVESLPTLYGTIENGTFEGTADGPDADGLFALLDSVGTVICKPTDGGKGTGIYVLDRRGERVSVNGGLMDRAAVRDVLESLDGYIVSEFVEQHPYADAIFPRATNTLRLYTVIDPETGAPEVLRAAHRFGSEDSAPIDNYSSGGYCAPVTVETGEIGRLIHLRPGYRVRRVDHPETGRRVAGVEVPFWEAVRDLVCEVADLHRGAPLVGWDVVVSEDGPVVLEGNARPGIDLLQLDGGVLEDPRVRRLLDIDVDSTAG